MLQITEFLSTPLTSVEQITKMFTRNLEDGLTQDKRFIPALNKSAVPILVQMRFNNLETSTS